MEGLAKKVRRREKKKEREREEKGFKKQFITSFSPRDQHRQQLVAQLRVGHRQPGLGVARLEHRVEEALVLVSWCFGFVEKGFFF